MQKAFLRAGPGEEHSPLMEVQGGTRLTVEARVGEWYRVISPTGTRAFIRGDVVQIPGLPRSSKPAAARPAQRTAPQPRAGSEDSGFPIPQSRGAQRAAGQDAGFPIPQTREREDAQGDFPMPSSRANIRDDESITDLAPRKGAAPAEPARGGPQVEQFDEDEEKALRRLREALIKK